MDRIWAVIRTNQKIVSSYSHHCTTQFWKRKKALATVMETLCHALEVSHPVWLSKHTRDMDRFGRTSFHEDDFIESICFDALELEYIAEKSNI